MNSFAGGGILQQFVLAILSLIVIFFILAIIEYLYKAYFALTYSKVSVLEHTAMSSNRMIIVTQNPSLSSSKTILVSDNELTGIEFSYTFFLKVGADTFNNNSTELKHVFHKGYSNGYPLLGPGVFILSDNNVMRVHMNSFNNWATYIDIENIPVDKWFHTALVYRKAGLEIYINGNLFKKLPFTDGDLPYQNFEDIVIFNRFNGLMSGGSSVPAVKNQKEKDDKFTNSIAGQMTGQISRLNYFRYALGFSEIQALMNEGPSSKIESDRDTNRVTPYLQDTWWTTTY